MRTPLIAVLAVGSIVAIAAVSPARAQELITSPTYIEIPPPQQEVITPAPAPSYVWVPGQWERTPDSWNWVSGQWVQPPFSNAYWVSGYWQHWGGQYQWETGHWAAGSQGVIAQKPVTVPPVYVEPQPPAPTGSYVWQPGYWQWRGTWLWVPGQYIATVSPQAVWVQGSWIAGVDGAWRWNPAHWEMRS